MPKAKYPSTESKLPPKKIPFFTLKGSFSTRVSVFTDLGTDIYLECLASNKNKTLMNEM